MVKQRYWKYLVDPLFPSLAGDWKDYFQNKGLQGWELVAIERGFAIFKKETYV